MRFVPVTYFALLAEYMVGDGKAYYLGSLYPLLLGLGAMPAAAWTLRSQPVRAGCCGRRSASRRS